MSFFGNRRQPGGTGDDKSPNEPGDESGNEFDYNQFQVNPPNLPIDDEDDDDDVGNFSWDTPRTPLPGQPVQQPVRRRMTNAEIAQQKADQEKASVKEARKRGCRLLIGFLFVVVIVLAVVLAAVAISNLPGPTSVVPQAGTTSTVATVVTTQPTLKSSMTPTPGPSAQEGFGTQTAEAMTQGQAIAASATAHAIANREVAESNLHIAETQVAQAQAYLGITPTGVPELATRVQEALATPMAAMAQTLNLNPGQCVITSEDLFIHWKGPYTPQSENGLPQSATDSQTIITAVEKTADGWVHIKVVGYLNHLNQRQNLNLEDNGWVSAGSPIQCNLTGVPFYTPAQAQTTATPERQG